MNILNGHSIGRYHLLEPLGEGGMAVVYKAYDTHLECEVAVKVIRIDNLPRNAEERALKRFEREAKAVAKLNHPNIVKVTDYGEEDGKPYLVMPYLPGGTLKQLIKDRRQIPWQEAAQLLTPIAEALAYAHSQGVIHRDVKPSNILLTSTGQPMLTDFGVAKVIEDEATQDLTGTSATVGTPEYMAPEQITSKTVDARADIYSLGVVFYEMVTGRRPFEADTPMAVMIKQAQDPLIKPSQYEKNLSKDVEQILIKTLSKNPDDRFQNAGEFSQKLQDVINKYKTSKTNNYSGEFNRQNNLNLGGIKRQTTVSKYLIGIVFLVLIGIGFLLILSKNKQIFILITSTPSIPPSSTIDISATGNVTILPSTTSSNTPSPTETITSTTSPSATHTVEPSVEPTLTKAPYLTPTPHSVTVDLLNYCFSPQDWYLNGQYIVTIGAQNRFDYQVLSGYYDTKNCDSGTNVCHLEEKKVEITGDAIFKPLNCK